MDSFSQAILQLVKGKSSVSVRYGTFSRVESNGQIARVLSPDGTALWSCQPMSSYRPEPGEQVTVLFVDGQPYLAGSGQSKPGRGTVSAVSGGVATVTTDIGPVVCSYGAAPAVGKSVRLAWQDGPHITDVVGVFPDQVPPDPDPVYKPTPHTFVFHATQSGQISWQGGWGATTIPGVWRPGNFVIYGRDDTVTLGYWSYGPQIINTIPPAAVVTAVDVYLPQWSGAAMRDLYLDPSTTPESAAAAQPVPATDDDRSAHLVTPADYATGRQAWWPVDLVQDAAFVQNLLTTEVAVRPGLNAGGFDIPLIMQGLDIYGDGQGDDLSGAIRITAIF